LRATFCTHKISVLERELLLTGIGGQGVQLAAQVVARAAIAEGREVQLFGSYGGLMRGGPTDATLVVGDGPIEAPPTVTGGWSAILVHPEFAAPIVDRLRPDAVVLYNETLFETPPPGGIPVPATALGHSPVNASLILVGAYSAVTGLVDIDSLLAAVDEALPPYRHQHVAGCQEALRTGHGAAPAERIAAWADAVSDMSAAGARPSGGKREA
jgi:Pyruvate/2-oxoacid:ferredoxin oxidoreductase gamma subunit